MFHENNKYNKKSINPINALINGSSFSNYFPTHFLHNFLQNFFKKRRNSSKFCFILLINSCLWSLAINFFSFIISYFLHHAVQTYFLIITYKLTFSAHFCMCNFSVIIYNKKLNTSYERYYFNWLLYSRQCNLIKVNKILFRTYPIISRAH